MAQITPTQQQSYGQIANYNISPGLRANGQSSALEVSSRGTLLVTPGQEGFQLSGTSNFNLIQINSTTIPTIGLTPTIPVEVLDKNGTQINSLPGMLDVNSPGISPFVQRNGSQFSLKGKHFKFVGFNYYPLIQSQSLATTKQLMNDAKALGVTVLRTWCFDPPGNFRSLFYPLGTNLLLNPSFETGDFTSWTVTNDTATWAVVSTTAHAGTYSAYIDASGGLGYHPFIYQSATVSTNTNYILTWWEKVQIIAGDGSHLPPEVRIGSTRGGTELGWSGFSSDTGGIWVRKQISFNTGSNTTIYIQIDNDGGEAKAYYDDFNLSLRSGTPHLEYYEPALVNIDTVLDEARKRGIKLIIDLADGNYNNYNTPGTYVNWVNTIYGDGLSTSQNLVDIAFFGSTHCKNLYKDFIKTLTQRVNTINGIQYRDDPAIFSWELGNELRCNAFEAGGVVNTLQSTNLALLSLPGGWADEMSAYIKSVDPNHMVNFGDMGHSWQNLQNGSGVGDVVYNGTYYGVDYGILSALPNIDFLDVHIYPDQDDNIHLGAASGKFWGQKFGYSTISGDGLRAQLKDYVSVAHANNKPAIIGEVGFVQGTTGDNTYYPLYNRYNAFKAIFTDFLDIPQGDGLLIWSAAPAATATSYDIALEATGGAGVTDNSNDTDIVNLVNTYNIALGNDAKYASPVAGLIINNGDIVQLNLNTGDNTISLQLSDTWTGTVQFESSLDGITWYAQLLADSTNAKVSSATAVGLFSGVIGNINKFRIRASASITGSLTVTIQSENI